MFVNRTVLSSQSNRIQYITAALLVMAAVITPSVVSAAPVSQLNIILKNIEDSLGLVIRILITLAIAVFVWGIVRLITAAGNPQQIKIAKAIMLYGIIAIAILALLTGIIAFLQSYFGITSGVPIKVPQF